mgnify:CR=1 FL=1
MAVFFALSANAMSLEAQRQQASALQQVEGQLANLTEAQREQMRQQIEMFTSPLVVAGIGFATRAIGLFIGWAIGAAILYFGLVIASQEIKFSQVFAAFRWKWLPFAVRDLVDAGIVVMSGTVMLNPGLSYFVATGDQLADARNPLWLLTSLIDLFFLWHIVLVYALIRAAKSRGSAVGLTVVYALLYLALRFLPSLLAARLSFGL